MADVKNKKLAFLLLAAFICLTFAAFDVSEQIVMNNSLPDTASVLSAGPVWTTLKHAASLPDSIPNVNANSVLSGMGTSQELTGYLYNMQGILFALLILLLYISISAPPLMSRFAAEIKRFGTLIMACSLGGNSPPIARA